MNIELCPKCLTPLQTNGVCMLCNYRAPYAPSLELDLDEGPDEIEEMQKESWNSDHSWNSNHSAANSKRQIGANDPNTQEIQEESAETAEMKTSTKESEREDLPFLSSEHPAKTHTMSTKREQVSLTEDSKAIEYNRSIPYMTPRIFRPKTEIEKDDHILFGEFSNAPIEWRVLEVKDGKALLFSENLLESVRYHNEEWVDVTWANSDLRAWMNGEFYESVFNDAEKEVILTAFNKNEDNPYFDTPGGCDTVDKVFLLSFTELQKYFEDYEYIGGFSADNCRWNGEILDQTFEFAWWTRTPGAEPHLVLAVDDYWDTLKQADGYPAYGFPDPSAIFLRPAIWIDAARLEEQMGKLEERKALWDRLNR